MLGGSCGEITRAPGEQEADDIARVMSGIREQGDGIDRQANDDLDDDVNDIEADTDGEGFVVVRRGVRMGMIV